jgi:hypothetical protein
MVAPTRTPTRALALALAIAGAITSDVVSAAFNPPIPVPPDRAARLDTLRSYSCPQGAPPAPKPTPPPSATGPGTFAMGAIGRGEAAYLEEWVRLLRDG